MAEVAPILRQKTTKALHERPDAARNRRILVVDDNKAIHEDFRKILGSGPAAENELDELHQALFGEDAPAASGEAFELDSAYQGEEALERVKTSLREHRPYALAFVDVRMPPGWDGVTTAAHMLETDPHLAVVICTAYSDYNWDQMTAAFGETDRVLILKKPFDTIEVRQLAQALQKRWQLARIAAMKVDELATLVNQQTRELRATNEKLKAEAAAREETLKQLADSHDEIRRLAYQDSLTGLPNRRMFDEVLEKALASARRHGEQFAVLFVDFDNFKRINDSMGHHAADAVLCELAQALSDVIRAEDVLAIYALRDGAAAVSRLGGDEFAIVLPHTRDRLCAGNVAERILARLSAPVRTGEHEVFVTASIGIASYPEDGDTAEILIRNADTAMYHAKQLGKAGYQFYSDSMNVVSVKRLKLEGALRRAIDQQRLEVHYQPQIDLRTGAVIGAEALLRWKDPDLGRLSPDDFIPLAEETGLILPLGEWVLREVCKQSAAWQASGLPRVPIAINISGVQFRRQDVPALIRRALEDTGLDPGLLAVELTETAMMLISDRAVAVLQELRDLGVKLALDDFGTGYSSLNYLKRFPIHAVKIDRTFVAEMLTDPPTASITEAVVSMAHALGLSVVAEGIEERAQLELLERYGCDQAQGFYFSSAVPAPRFAELLRDRR